jgi:prepilin-type N-terminal cleavage/methylation domain-containing protein
MTTARLRTLGGFTIVEMLVVVSIVAILVTLAVPSFQAMLRGSEEVLAENQLKAAMRASRDAAIRSGSGNDAAAVFFFTEEGRMQIVACVRAGLIRDIAFDVRGDETIVEREVFVAATGVQAAQLPKNWTVRGYVPPAYIEETRVEGWYSSRDVGQGSPRYQADQPNWVFPETAYINATRANEGPKRSTFMVRFEGGTGRLVTSPADAVLVLAPAMTPEAIQGGANSLQLRNIDAGTVSEWHRNIGADPAGYVQKISRTRMTLSAPAPAVMAANAGEVRSDRQALLGRISTDMVLTRPVTQIALLDETRLARALGVELPRGWNAVVQPLDPSRTNLDLDDREPAFPIAADGPNGAAARVNAWIEGDSNNDGQYGQTDPTRPVANRDEVEAKVFVFDRYTGAPKRAEIQREPVR